VAGWRRCLHQLILVLVGKGLGDGNGLQHINEADNDRQLELLTEVFHCTGDVCCQ